ncbi:MAG: hypothetical protein HUN05_01655 [Desulfobacter sp.]|nr:MAG: hypothetical protein HUN05_01655 [Desulfobacter sp.]
MPVEQTKGRLIFGETELNWSQPSQWSGKKISLSLAPDVSEILWSAIEAGQTLMSVEITQTLSGVRQNPDKKWEKAGVSMGATLPITLDMKAYPSLFRRIDLDGRMVRGYTGIDVFCFDFLEHLDDTLYSKVIDIAIPTTGNPLVETITFNQESDYRARVEFKLAKDLDTAYKIRITRVYMDGTTQQGTWVKRKGEAMLDITDYRGDDHGQDLEDENEQNTNE